MDAIKDKWRAMDETYKLFWITAFFIFMVIIFSPRTIEKLARLDTPPQVEQTNIETVDK